MKKFIKSTKLMYTLYFLFANVLLATAYIPNYITAANPIQNYTYTWLHQYPVDYYLYLTAINDGRNGSIRFHQKYSTEPSKPSIFYIFYTLLGHVGRITNLPNYAMYHMAKILGAELLFVGILLLSHHALGSKFGIIGAFAALILTSPPQLIMGTPLTFIFSPWWFGFNAIERIDMLPHHLTNIALSIVTSYLTMRIIKKPHSALLALTLFFAAAHMLFFPPTMLLYALVLPLSIFLFSIQESIHLRHVSLPNRNILIAVTALFIVSLTSFCTIKWQESLGFPWNQWTPWEVHRWNVAEPTFDQTVISLFHIYPILALIACIVALKKRMVSFIYISLWVLIPFVLLPFANQLSVPKIRLFQIGIFIPIGLILAFLLSNTPKALQKLATIFVIIFLFINLSVAFGQYNAKISYTKDNKGWGGYMHNDTLEAFRFMDTHLPANATVLSYEYEGISIPSFTKQKVYWAQLTHTYDFFRKKDEVIAFYSQTLSDSEAYSFLQKNGIQFVYQGIFETEISKARTLRYPFLTIIHQNDIVTIFAVNKHME
jgi:hypothetical protein